MSIRRSRNGQGWEARWRANGVRHSATFRTKREAEEAERLGRDRARARKHGLPVEQGPITYADLCDRYLDQHQVSERTIQTLRERLRYSRDAFGTRPVRELLPEEISRWNARLALSSTTRGHALRAMRQVLAAGERWGYLARNPAGAQAVRMPPTAPHLIRPFETWAQVEAVGEATKQYRALVVFTCATGLRPQEWQALEWQDVDWSGRRCHVFRTAHRDRVVVPTGKTDGALRTVMLQQRALDALALLPRPLNSGQRIFSAPEGGIVNLGNFRQRVWRPALAATGLEYRPVYEMRHTFATLALAAGVPIEWISKQVGHTNIRTTLKHYARFLPAVDERALATLDAFEADRGGRKVDAIADA